MENKQFEKLLNDIEKLFYIYEHSKCRSEDKRELKCFFARLKRDTKRTMEDLDNEK